MTRQEFIETVTDWPELIDFARDNEMYDLTDDYLDDDDIDYEVNDALSEMVHDDWRRVRDLLDNIPEDTGYFHRVGWLNYEYVDEDDFLDLKDDVLEEADAQGYFDEDDEEDIDEDEDDDDSCENGGTGCEPDATDVMAVLFGAVVSSTLASAS